MPLLSVLRNLLFFVILIGVIRSCVIGPPVEHHEVHSHSHPDQDMFDTDTDRDKGPEKPIIEPPPPPPRPRIIP